MIGEVNVEISLWAFVWREGRRYVAYEPTTGVSSQGKTLDDALSNLKEALELYLEDGENLPYKISRVAVMKINVRVPDARINEIKALFE